MQVIKNTILKDIITLEHNTFDKSKNNPAHLLLNASENRRVFKRDLKCLSDLADLTYSGKLFQIFGSATEKVQFTSDFKFSLEWRALWFYNGDT